MGGIRRRILAKVKNKMLRRPSIPRTQGDTGSRTTLFEILVTVDRMGKRS